MKTNVSKTQLTCLLLLIQTVGTAKVHGQNQDLVNILKALSPEPGKTLTGYKITARETNITFSHFSPIAMMLKSDSAKLDGESRAILEEELRKHPGNQTNVSSYIYRFGDTGASISCQVFDSFGKLIRERKTLLWDDEVFEFRQGYEQDRDHNPDYGSGSIKNRDPNELVGIPTFFSKSTLRDFITKSPNSSVEIGSLSENQHGYVVTLSATPGSGLGISKLFFESGALRPIGLNNYLADGAPYTVCDLQFDELGRRPFVCNRAETQLLAKGGLSMLFIWINEGVERDEPPLTDNRESFFPPRARIADSRQAKSLFYHMGKRLPSSNQLNLMTTSIKGVAAYEAATSVRLPGDLTIKPPKSSLLVVSVMVCIGLAPLLFFIQKRARH